VRQGSRWGVAGAGRREHEAVQLEAAGLAEGAAQALVEDGEEADLRADGAGEREAEVGVVGAGAVQKVGHARVALDGVGELERNQDHLGVSGRGDPIDDLLGGRGVLLEERAVDVHLGA